VKARLLAPAATLLLLPLQAQPRLQRFTLPNGLRVVHLEDRERPLVQVLLHLGVEPADTPAGCQGLPELALRVIGHSDTADLRTEAFNRLLDDAGIQLAAFKVPDGLTWRLVARSRDQDRALGLLADRLQRTLLDPSMLEVQRLAAWRHEERQEGHPNEHLHQALSEGPDGRPTQASLNAISFEQLLQFKARVFRPDRAVLVIHGDLGLEQTKRLLLLSLGAWTAQKQPPAVASPLVAVPASRESSPRIPGPGPGLRIQAVADRPDGLSPEATALLSILVASDAALAPVQVSVEGTGLVATLDAGPGTGARWDTPGSDPWSLFHGHLETLRRRGFTQTDLNLAKVAWQARRSLDSLHTEAQMDAALAEAKGRGVSPDRMQALSLSELNAALRGWLDPARLRSGAAGDPEALKMLPKP